jgi:hypothetical protein
MLTLAVMLGDWLRDVSRVDGVNSHDELKHGLEA